MTAEQEKRVTDNLGLIHGVLRKYTWTNNNYEDYYQAGCVGLVMAAQNYDADRGIAFSTYATSCIRGQVCKLYFDHECSRFSFPRSFAQKHGVQALPECVSLQDIVADADGVTVEETVSDGNHDIDDMILDTAIKQAIQKLSKKDKAIALMLMDGVTQVEIAAELNITKQWVNERIKKIRHVLRVVR